MQRIRTSQNGTWPIATVDRSTCRQLPPIEKTLFLLPVRTQLSGMMCFGQLWASDCAKVQSHSLGAGAQSQTQAHTAEDDIRSHVAALHIHTDVRQMPELDTYTNGTSGPTGYASPCSPLRQHAAQQAQLKTPTAFISLFMCVVGATGTVLDHPHAIHIPASGKRSTGICTDLAGSSTAQQHQATNSLC